ncbi:MAG: SMC-Scp complex subunit ScpB [Chitinophagaceae bacterium]|nr:MAG: SMC-Scp complex subunit ScpB [Chitinophagaceae bacterium]
MSQIIPHIEALIFASDKPLTAPEVTEYVNNALGFIEDRASLEQVEAAMEGIKEKYDAEFYAFELKQSGGGWQFLTKPLYHKTVALLNGDKFIKKLSTAALETLAIIAYKQPITKSEIESIRGVNCDYAVQKLLEKDLVIISGRNEDAVGKPLIYGTSKSFMDYFGINSADELPRISEVLMEEFEKATAVKDIIGGDSLEEFVPTEVKDENHDGIIDDTFDAETEAAIDAVAVQEENNVSIELNSDEESIEEDIDTKEEEAQEIEENEPSEENEFSEEDEDAQADDSIDAEEEAEKKPEE